MQISEVHRSIHFHRVNILSTHHTDRETEQWSPRKALSLPFSVMIPQRHLLFLVPSQRLPVFELYVKYLSVSSCVSFFVTQHSVCENAAACNSRIDVHGCVAFQCVHIPQCIYPYWWTFGLLTVFLYGITHSSTINVSVHFSWWMYVNSWVYLELLDHW